MAQTLEDGMHLAIHATWTNGRDIVTSWHAVMTDTGDRPAACQQYAQIVSDAWVARILPILANNYVHDRVDWVDLHSDDGSTGAYVRGTAVAGTLTTENTGPQQGVVIKKNIAGSGRRYRSGRLFWPGGTETGIGENGDISSGSMAAYTVPLSNFFSDCNRAVVTGDIAAATLCVAHVPSIEVTETKTFRKPDPDGIMVASDITGFTVDPVVSGIRRRARG